MPKNKKRTRNFIVTGLMPAISQQANQLLKAFDLGIEGAFVKSTQLVTVTLSDDITEEQLIEHPNDIKLAFKQSGWQDVEVAEAGGEAASDEYPKVGTRCKKPSS